MRHWPQVWVMEWMVQFPKKKKRMIIFFLSYFQPLLEVWEGKKPHLILFIFCTQQDFMRNQLSCWPGTENGVGHSHTSTPHPRGESKSWVSILNQKLWLKHFLWLGLCEDDTFYKDSPAPDRGVHTTPHQSHQQTFSLHSPGHLQKYLEDFRSPLGFPYHGPIGLKWD